MNKVIYITSYFKRVGQNVVKKVPTGEKKKGLFGEKNVIKKATVWEDTGSSDHEIDGARLASDIGKAITTLNSEGYEVVCVSEAISGAYNHHWGSTNPGGYGYGYGYSYTEGVTIIAKKIGR